MGGNKNVYGGKFLKNEIAGVRIRHSRVLYAHQYAFRDSLEIRKGELRIA